MKLKGSRKKLFYQVSSTSASTEKRPIYYPYADRQGDERRTNCECLEREIGNSNKVKMQTSGKTFIAYDGPNRRTSYHRLRERGRISMDKGKNKSNTPAGQEIQEKRTIEP